MENLPVKVSLTSTAVKPVYVGHPWNQGILSTIGRCPLNPCDTHKYLVISWGLELSVQKTQVSTNSGIVIENLPVDHNVTAMVSAYFSWKNSS